jgi:hypothetical protein
MMIINRRSVLLTKAAPLAAEASATPLAALRRAGIKQSSWLRARTAICGGLLGVTFIAAPAFAEITEVTVNTTADIGPFRGKLYREIHATMEGAAPGGPYAVPVTLAVPKDAAAQNGFAVLDVINTVTIGQETWPGGGRAFPVARVHLGDDYLFGNGNIYVGVIWDKKAVEALNNGVIAMPADGYTILRDAAALARKPAKHLPSGETSASADHVVAYGYSQTGSLLRGWFTEKLNQVEGAPTFDAALIGVPGGFCKDLDPEADTVCQGPISDGAKLTVVNTETDVEWTGFLERGETEDYRVVEIAGTSHIPTVAADFRQHGLPQQNPADPYPVFRATMTNLQQWVRGTEPPPSIYMELAEGEPESLMDSPLRHAARDKDGNALGGVRLPHMAAPVGTYEGLDHDFKDSNVFFLISGVYEPFSTEELAARYTDHDAYVAMVSAAANELVAKRYMLEEDALPLIDAAKRSDVGRR